MTENMQEMLESAAFPFTHNPKEESVTATGMTLRDYFAAKAMQGYMLPHDMRGGKESKLWLAKSAYEMADAMMKARAE